MKKEKNIDFMKLAGFVQKNEGIAKVMCVGTAKCHD